MQGKGRAPSEVGGRGEAEEIIWRLDSHHREVDFQDELHVLLEQISILAGRRT